MTRISWRRVLLLLAPPLVVLLAIVYFGSPRGLAGSTRCLPFVGPRIAIDTSLRGDARALAVAHEAAHATQCREQGAVRNYFARLSRNGRLDSELGAYCAEARAALRLGQRADLVVSRILDELEEGYPWFRGTSRGEFRAGLVRACPDVVPANESS